jgi:hypothetical protein
MADMWAYLSTWIVQDGQLPPIEVGSLLPNIGVKVIGTLTERSAQTEEAGIAPLADAGVIAPSAYRYSVTGVAGLAEDVLRMMGPDEGLHPRHMGAEFVLSCGERRFIASAANAYADQIVAGSVVTVEGHFSIMAEHEFEVSETPRLGVAAGWRVAALKVEQYAVVWHERSPMGRPAWVGDIGETIDVFDVRAVDAWQDERRFATEHVAGVAESTDFLYILDLEPV